MRDPPKNGNVRHVRAGRDLPTDAVYVLNEGWAIVYDLSESGRRQILSFAVSGDVLGYQPDHTKPISYRIQALTGLVVRIISREVVERACAKDPQVAMRMARSIANERNLAYDHLSSVGKQRARERVAHLLLELFIRSQRRWPSREREVIELPVTQQEIGDATGLTGIHVNRILRNLGKEEIVEFQRRRLRILSAEKLIAVSAIRPELASTWIDVVPPVPADAEFSTGDPVQESRLPDGDRVLDRCPDT
jgi:CRP-like cAMP-binding protein